MYNRVPQDSAPVENFVNILIIVIAVLLGAALLAVSLFFLYRVLRKYALKNLEYRRYFSESGAFENDEIELIEELTNHGFLPMFRVDVETHVTTKLYMPGVGGGNEINQEFISRFFVMPFTKIRRHHKIILKQRGHYRLESAKIYFMKIELFLDSRAQVKVYPKELLIEERERVNRSVLVNTVSRMPVLKDPFSFARVREYTAGDQRNFINHKATARFGKLMVNETDFVLGRKLLMCINFQAGNTGIPVEEFDVIMEKAMEFAAYIAGEACRRGWQVGLAANCRTDTGGRHIMVDIGSGYGKYIEILEALADAEIMFGYSVGKILDTVTDAGVENTEIMIFSTYVDYSMEKRIEILERHGNTVTLTDLKEVTAV